MANLLLSESPKARQPTPAPATQVPVMLPGVAAGVNPAFQTVLFSPGASSVYEVSRCLLSGPSGLLSAYLKSRAASYAFRAALAPSSFLLFKKLASFACVF